VQIGTWLPAPEALTYLWKSNGIPVGDASNYTVADADLGHGITVTVTASSAGYATTSRTSVKQVIFSPFLSSPVPGLPSVVYVGDELTPGCAEGQVCDQQCYEDGCYDWVYEDAWDPSYPTKFSYQWLRDGLAIKGAVKRSYIAANADVGAKLTLRVSASLASYEKTSVLSNETSPVQLHAFDVAEVPFLDVMSPAFGQTITATVSEWSPSPSKKSYQWFRDGVVIKGATKLSYTVGLADIDRVLTFGETCQLASYATTTVSSLPTAPVAKADINSPELPLISGIIAAGKKLTAVPGVWTPKSAKLAFQWMRGGEVIPSATALSYTLSNADIGEQISVSVTGSLAGYNTKVLESSPTAPIFPSTFIKIGKVTVIGAVGLGKTLTASVGTWQPAATVLSYQWLRDGVSIEGESDPTLSLSADDAGHKISVSVTASVEGIAPVSQTASAGAWVIKTFTKKITGGQLYSLCESIGENDTPCAYDDEDPSIGGAYSSGELDDNLESIYSEAGFTIALDREPLTWKAAFGSVTKASDATFYYRAMTNEFSEADPFLILSKGLRNATVATGVSRLHSGLEVSFGLGSYAVDEFMLLKSVTITYTAYQ
jgi:hypothetical protein